MQWRLNISSVRLTIHGRSVHRGTRDSFKRVIYGKIRSQLFPNPPCAFCFRHVSPSGAEGVYDLMSSLQSAKLVHDWLHFAGKSCVCSEVACYDMLDRLQCYNHLLPLQEKLSQKVVSFHVSAQSSISYAGDHIWYKCSLCHDAEPPLTTLLAFCLFSLLTFHRCYKTFQCKLLMTSSMYTTELCITI